MFPVDGSLAHGAPLPSHGSRRSRFPTVSGTMRALRLPVRASPIRYDFRFGFHASPSFVFAVALPERRRTTAGPGSFVQPVSLYPAYRMRLRTGSLRFPGDPSHTFALFPDPGRTGDTSPLAVPSMLPPVPTRRRLQQEHDFEAYPGLQSAAYASRAASPPPMQGSLPAGGLRLCREGVEPSGSQRKVSGYIHPPFQDFPDASWAHMRRGFFQFHASTQSPLAAEGTHACRVALRDRGRDPRTSPRASTPGSTGTKQADRRDAV